MKIFIILCFSALVFPKALIASQYELQEEERIKYTSILVGYNVEEGCRFGTEEMLQDFKSSLKVIDKVFSMRGIDKKYLEELVIDAEKIWNLKKFSECGKVAKEVAATSFRTSWTWSSEMIKKTKKMTKKNSALREAAGRGEQIFGGIMLAQRCNSLEKLAYDDFEAKAKAIIGVVKKGLGQDKVNAMVKRAQLGIQHKDYADCGDKAETFISASKNFVDETYSILSAKTN